jgi:UDP-2-acetamido-3-amino-2,3-dideoxy-glucuronate N-acetyltransferase
VSSAAVHPAAIVEAAAVPTGTTVGAYSRIGAEVEFAGPVTIGEQTLLSGRIQAAGGVEVASQSYLNGPLIIEAGVRIAPRCCIDAGGGAPIVLGEGATIGANATLWPGVTVGRRACVEPGSVVTKNVPAMAVVAGNPAQIVRYSGAPSGPPQAHTAVTEEVTPTAIRGVTLRRLPLHEDLRGALTFGEASRHVPFPIRRYFLSFAVTSEQVRGEHAHRSLHQFLVCAHGRVHIVADDGVNQADFLLDRPDIGIHVPPMVWSVQYRFSPDAVLLALCSEPYDPADYIRDYAEFLALVRAVC